MSQNWVHTAHTDLPADSHWSKLGVASMIAAKLIPDGPVRMEAVTVNNSKLTDSEIEHIMEGGLLIQYFIEADEASVRFAFPDGQDVYVGTYMLKPTSVGEARGGQVFERFRQKVATMSADGKMVAESNAAEIWH